LWIVGEPDAAKPKADGMIANPAQVLAHHADRHTDELALVSEALSLTWSELHERVQLTAGALTALGVGPGDPVAVLLHNSTWPIELMYASAHIGAVYMPLNWRLAGPELNYIINHAQAKLLVSEHELAGLVREAGELCVAETVSVDGNCGWSELETVRAGSATMATAVEVERDQLARLMYTSGTTARPKGVMISFGNIEAKNLAHIVEFGICRAHRNLVCGPLYHTAALDGTTTTFLQVGGPTFIMRRFDPLMVFDAIERHGITHVWMAPAMINAVLREKTLLERDLRSVELLMNGGEKMPVPLIQRTLDAFPNAWFADGYGMTETVSGDAYLGSAFTLSKLGSVGKPVLNVELMIVDDADQPVPVGTSGEIVMRGPKVCTGYFRDPEASALTFRGGWLHTGDVGVIDEDGFLFIVDRLKDMIKTGGENVASLEVERVIQQHPAVSEVAVIGRPDPQWSEVPVAYVVCPAEPPSEEELLDFCRERLASFKVPNAIRFVDELPRTPSGKVLKRDLRASDVSELGGAAQGEVVSPRRGDR
jgi:acyl-CoA synthetase (AMP-forming)/AMP-acid ligase II